MTILQIKVTSTTICSNGCA